MNDRFRMAKFVTNRPVPSKTKMLGSGMWQSRKLQDINHDSSMGSKQEAV
jgi:hypothetical protein